MDQTVTDPLVGRVLDGRYLVGPRIARGGMATVYEGRDTRLDRPVAVKVMNPAYADDPAFVRRFVREARSAARLSHPGVVAVFDQGEDAGTLFLVMEYVPGRTLRQLLHDEGPLPPARALALFEPILDALAVAHRAGIVHLDVKPENVLLGPHGQVKVADFGLARAMSTSPSTATQGLLIGTISYLAPEQVVHGTVDARSDLYAAGIVLYEMLTGAKPYGGDSPISVAYRHVHDDVPPPSRSGVDVPPYVDGLVLRATARDPDGRPGDTGAFLQQVRQARAALARGLSDDPALTEDLTLVRRTSVQTAPSITHTAVVPLAEAGVPDSEPTAADSGGTGAGGRFRGFLRGSSSRRRRLVASLLVFLLTVAVVALGWYVGVGRYVEVPPLRGTTSAVAAEDLRAHGLRLDVAGKVFHEVIDAGEIVRSAPDSSSRVLRGSAVEVWLSRGPERYAMPELGGQTEAVARRLVEEANLRVAEVERAYSDTVAAGHVVSFSPEPGTQLRRDSPVRMTVSRGREPIAVPSVVGASADEAEQAITDAGLRASPSEAYSNEAPQGVVIRQKPADGTLFRGDAVRYVVSLGPELVEVPNVRGRPEDVAEELLEDAGFEVETEEAAIYFGADLVANQTPEGGTAVPRGSTVVLEMV